MGFWTWENALLVALIPVGAALVVGLRDVLRSPSPFLMLTLLALYLGAGVAIGGMGLGIAWGIVETVADWKDPYARSAAGASAVLLLALLTWVAYLPEKRGRAKQ